MPDLTPIHARLLSSAVIGGWLLTCCDPAVKQQPVGAQGAACFALSTSPQPVHLDLHRVQVLPLCPKRILPFGEVDGMVPLVA